MILFYKYLVTEEGSDDEDNDDEDDVKSTLSPRKVMSVRKWRRVWTALCWEQAGGTFLCFFCNH